MLTELCAKMKALLLMFVFVNNCFATFGDIRCFCNLSMCVRESYMCKSSGVNASCFFEQLMPGSGPETARHGCIEHLGKHKYEVCERQVNSRKEVQLQMEEYQTQQSPHSSRHRTGNSNEHNRNRYPKMYCCADDMCNYVSSYEMTVNVETKSTSSQQGAYISGNSSIPDIYNNISDLWLFRIAVIVVPIAGSIVLVLLFLVAAKVLREERTGHTNLFFKKNIQGSDFSVITECNG